MTLVSYSQNLPTACVNSRVRYSVDPVTGIITDWKEVKGGTVNASSDTAVDIIWGNNPGLATVRYQAISSFGCVGNELTGYVMLSAPRTNLGFDKQICDGDSIVFDAGTGYNYRWSDGSIKQNFVARNSGVYWVQVTDSVGCTFVDSINISVNNMPKINLGKDQVLCNPTTLTLDAGTLGVLYEWSNGDIASSIIAHEGDGSIWVKVTDANGCIGTDTIEILKCIEVGTIPNAFTPNGDGFNDVWHVRQDDKAADYPNMIVKIYDRWGRLVFESNKGYTAPWDGTSKGKPLPMDTYYYIIDFGDGTPEKVGSVAIIR
jgi:gliding motility-associated-like protein